MSLRFEMRFFLFSIKLCAKTLSAFTATLIYNFFPAFGGHTCLETMALMTFSFVAFAKHILILKMR